MFLRRLLRPTVELPIRFCHQLPDGFVHLRQRLLVEVRGRESGAFLQNLLTCDLRRFAGVEVDDSSATTTLPHLVTATVDTASEATGNGSSQALYGFLLNQKGRILCDLIVYHMLNVPEPTFLVECDALMANQFVKTLLLYRLRKKITVRINMDLACCNLPAGNGDDLKCGDVETVVTDPRHPELGKRVICRRTTAGGHETPDKLSDYAKRRYKLGIAEGSGELIAEKSLPLECNADFLHAASFNKGCYIGQELTARTHHTGVIRKRIMPVRVNAGSSDVMESMVDTVALGEFHRYPTAELNGRPVGRVLGISPSGWGIALLRVAQVVGRQIDLNFVTSHEVECRTTAEVFVPRWWPDEARKSLHLDIA